MRTIEKRHNIQGLEAVGDRSELAVELPQLLTTEQLASWIRVSVGTIYNWRVQQTGPRGARVGRRTLYRVDEVRNWLNERTDVA